ncbi:extracellular solute-binding protein [Sulfuricurvum sp.]|uniref:extracellular solute-binding protein n=1 Tax=Sulfuricurvum sp. TaxID=2025608 RepID=UPI00260FCD52|nr:extracellular solute-binding protein [Sulfuricurvum sp.]MDD2782334.1 extracellular solute-binding protein [Sulfuricurvum sp.]
MKSYFLATLFLSTIFLFFSGCQNSNETASKPTLKRAYEGQSIILIVPTLEARLIRGPILDEVEAFEKKTGGKVRVVTPSWNETIEKIDQSLTDPNLNYDIFVVISMWNGTLLGNNHIEPIPESIKKQIDWEDILPIYRNSVLSWNNKSYGLPYDGDCINLYYRKDLFENPKNRTAFQNRYGYPLTPPKTWKSFRDVAEFFNGWDWDNDGKPEYGMAGLRVKNDISMLQFFAQAAAYAKHPDDKAYYFDPETMKPRINNPAFVKALKDYIDFMQFGPPGMASFAGHDVRNAFASGEVAMAMDWADMGIFAANSPVSIVKNNVGYSQIPGSDTVYNARTSLWDKRANSVSSISGNWMFLVNKESKNKELAFAFAAHMTSKEMTKKLTATNGTAVNPSRYSHFNDPASWNSAGFSTPSAKAYLDEITVSLKNPNVVYDITIPGAGEYYQAIDEYAYKALMGEMKPQEAMNKASAEWEKITDKIGREKQSSFYKSSLN